MSNYYPNDTLPSSTSAYFGNSSYYYKKAMLNGTHGDGDYTSSGAWYNFMAMTADTATSSYVSGDMTYDICPKNWIVPSKTEYDQLTAALGSNNGNKFYPPKAGFFSTSSITASGVRDAWFTRTITSSSSVADYNWTTNNVISTGGMGRANAEPVRCFKSTR